MPESSRASCCLQGRSSTSWSSVRRGRSSASTETASSRTRRAVSTNPERVPDLNPRTHEYSFENTWAACPGTRVFPVGRRAVPLNISHAPLQKGSKGQPQVVEGAVQGSDWCCGSGLTSWCSGSGLTSWCSGSGLTSWCSGSSLTSWCGGSGLTSWCSGSGPTSWYGESDPTVCVVNLASTVGLLPTPCVRPWSPTSVNIGCFVLIRAPPAWLPR